MVDLGPLMEHCEKEMAHGAAPWHRRLSDFPAQPSLLCLLTLLAGCAAGHSLFAQLLLWLAQRVEVALAGNGAGEKGHLSVQGGRRGAPTVHNMQLRLAKMLHSCRMYCEDNAPIVFMSCATDKSSVGGLPLHNTFLQINGAAAVMMALPQAVWFFVGGGGVCGGTFTERFLALLGDTFRFLFRVMFFSWGPVPTKHIAKRLPKSITQSGRRPTG